MPIVFYSLRGTNNYRKKHMGQVHGKYSIYNKFTGEIKGKYAIIDVYEKYTGEIKAHYAILRKYEGEIIGRYRSAEDAVDQYELYKGEDAMPDFDAAPWETFTSFPHETDVLAADTTYYFVLRKRNKYGVLSQNTTPTVFTIDDGGDQITNPPSNASDITLAQVATMSMNVSAIYNSRQDETPADTWLLYFTDDDSSPDPDADTPVEVEMEYEAGNAWLDYDYGPKDDNTTIKVIVRTRVSGSPDADSDDETIYEDEITANFPAAVDADIMSDVIYGHAQIGSISALRLNFDFDADEDGTEYITNDDNIKQAKLVQINDEPGNNLNSDLWDDDSGQATESGGKWSIDSGGGGIAELTGVQSSDSGGGGPVYKMFQYADIRFIVNVPGAPPSNIYSRLWFHSALFLEMQLVDASTPYLQWRILDTGGSGDSSGTIPFLDTKYAVRLHRASSNVARVEYRTDTENYKLDTGWTLAGTAVLSGPNIGSKTGKIFNISQGSSKTYEVLGIWKKPDDGDLFYSPPQLDPIAYLRDGLHSWAAFDEGGVSVSNVEMTETIPTNCQIHYVYTSNATGSRPNRATMIALSHYTSFATFKTALEADAGIDKYLYIGVLLYGPAETDPQILNNTTPVISEPVLDY